MNYEQNIYVYMTRYATVCRVLVMVCGMYHSVTGRNPPMRCRGSGVTIVRCQGPGHRSYYSLTHSLTRPLSPELTTPPHFPLSWELRLSTQIFVTAVTPSVQSSQGTNDQQEYEMVLCNMEWNSVLTIWIEVENDQKWIYRKDFFNYTNQIV